MKCCGEEIKTAFCPTCGKRGPKTGLLKGLLGYLRQNQKEAEKRYAFSVDWGKGEHGQQKSARCREHRLEHRQRIVDKWKSWADQLEEVMRRAGDAEAQD